MMDGMHPRVEWCLPMVCCAHTMMGQPMVDATHPMMFDCLTIGEDVQLWVLMVSPSWMVRNLGNSVRIAIT